MRLPHGSLAAVCLSAALMFLARQAACGQEGRGVVVHPVPWEFASARFAVNVDGRPATVFLAALNVHFVSFDFTAPVQVTVTAQKQDYNRIDGVAYPAPENFWQGAAVVRPLSRGVKAITTGPEVSFEITKPGQYSIERPGTGGHQDEVLLLFANAPEADVPDASDPKVIWLGPGTHQRSIDLTSGQTLYLAPGAVLFGGIDVWDARDVRICGRGTVVHAGPQSQNVDSGWVHRRDWHPLTTHGVTNLRVEGVTFVARSRVWTIQMWETWDAVFDNIKIINTTTANLNGDGIDWYGGGRAKVRNSFFRTADDCFAVHPADAHLALRVDSGGGGHLPGAPATQPRHARGAVGDIEIEGCVFWPTLANVFRAGWSHQSLATKNVTIRDCDVIHISDHVWLGANDDLFTAVSPNGTGDALHRNYEFADIRFEASGALLAVNLPGAKLENFRFRRITFAAGASARVCYVQAPTASTSSRLKSETKWPATRRPCASKRTVRSRIFAFDRRSGDSVAENSTPAGVPKVKSLSLAPLRGARADLCSATDGVGLRPHFFIISFSFPPGILCVLAALRANARPQIARPKTRRFWEMQQAHSVCRRLCRDLAAPDFLSASKRSPLRFFTAATDGTRSVPVTFFASLLILVAGQKLP